MNFLNELNNIKKLILRKENIYFALLAVIIFFFDRTSKVEILENFNNNSYFLNNFINLNLIWNTGIGFGLLSSNSTIVYSLITFLIGLVILILFYITIISSKFDKLIYSIIIGAACGNFYDRLIYNAVPDFIDLHYKNFHWFTFNVADIFITFGIMIFIIRSFFIKN
ncbi:signal peptidase II [Pelagibacteraceae bacterium]|nr:signal peptidase II [Pelagibacteraceae bacterium]